LFSYGIVITWYCLRKFPVAGKRPWRYQRDNHIPEIEEGQTTQWPKEKGQKVKQRSTKQTHQSKDRVTWTPLKTGDELKRSGRVTSSTFGVVYW
jgi:hypothetical protein